MCVPTGCRRRLRRFFATHDAPGWLKRLVGARVLVGAEETVWRERADAAGGGAMELDTYTVNESHAHLIRCEEFVALRPHPHDGAKCDGC